MTRRKNKRSVNGTQYKKRIYVQGEGPTEGAYFNHIGKLYQSKITIDSKGSTKGNSPSQVLEKMRNRLKGKKLNAKDEVWLVIDHDDRKDSDFGELRKWKKESENYYFAVSKRDFEYWRLLHFHPGNGFGTDYIAYHKKLADILGIKVEHIKNQRIGKTLLKKQFTTTNFEEATKRAKKRKNEFFNSDVYLLAEKIINA